MADIIQVRRDLAATWTSVNPILADGEFGYEKDTSKLKMGDGVTAWNGLGYYAAGIAGGKVLQVVQSVLTAHTATTSTSYVASGLSATITPASATSKILVMISGGSFYVYGPSATPYALSRLKRGAVDLTPTTNGIGYIQGTGPWSTVQHSFSLLDSPATVAATTYSTDFAVGVVGDTAGYNSGGVVTMTLIEVAA